MRHENFYLPSYKLINYKQFLCVMSLATIAKTRRVTELYAEGLENNLVLGSNLGLWQG